MKWLMQFYDEERRILAPCSAEAATPAQAVPLGLQQVLAAHPARPPRRLRLLDRAERAAGRDDSGWVLYRIVREV